MKSKIFSKLYVVKKVFLLFTITTFIAGCSMFGSEEQETSLSGKRISILTHSDKTSIKKKGGSKHISLSASHTNNSWSQAGGNRSNLLGHLTLNSGLKRVWRSDIGSGSSDDNRLLSTPVVHNDMLFALDSDGRVTAINSASGKHLWKSSIMNEEDEDAYLGGGLAYGDDKLFVTTGAGEVLALNPLSGETLWSVSTTAPVRSAPTYNNGKLFVLTVNNQLHALSAEDGSSLWYHTGMSEITTILGGSSPAIAGETVIVPYSSGEVYALRESNGHELWSQSLVLNRHSNAVISLTDIKALPVIDNNTIYITNHGGVFAAIDLRTGSRLWEREIGSLETPWVSGNSIFVLTSDSRLVCLSKQSGDLVWEQQLRKFKDEDDHYDLVRWHGPVLANNNLILVNSLGDVHFYSVENGDLAKSFSTDNVAVAPIVANNTLFLLLESGNISAYK